MSASSGAQGQRHRVVVIGGGFGGLQPAPVYVFPLMSSREAFARSLEPGRRGKVVLAVA